MAISDLNYSSDEDDHIVDVKVHKKLIENVTNTLGKTQHIQKPTRKEPSLTTDEFHLVKSGPSEELKIKDTSVSVGDLVKVLNKTNKNLSVGRELSNTARNKKVLPKPLEKPVAERIQRTIGYEKTKKDLSKWDAVVANNRSAEHQVFPMETETIFVDLKSKKIMSQRSIKSDLMIEMEAIDKKLRAVKKLKKDSNEKDTTELEIQEKITKDEMIARRKELAYMRMRESQKSIKARLQNKIKSKKFHKLLKKDKLKEQLKDFETLQKINPEAALEKLEQIEKNRIHERAQLRHKNTGTWAKNLQVRAKYDKDVRKDLSEQLALSRELTQKMKQEEDDAEDNPNSDSDQEEKELVEVDPFNPWVKVSRKQNKNEVDDLVSGYRKYWLERNENQAKLVEYNESSLSNKTENQNQDVQQPSEAKSDKLSTKLLKKNKKAIKNIEKKAKNTNESTSHEISFESAKKQIDRKSTVENGWVVEELEPNLNIHCNNNIDDIFDEAEDILKQKSKNKLHKLSESLKNGKSVPKKATKNRDELQNLKNLTFKNQVQRVDFDEELIETAGKKSSEVNIRAPITKNSNEKEVKSSDVIDIDPNKFAEIKPKNLITALPDIGISSELLEDDELNQDDENYKQMAIAEAFCDDDIVADFAKEKDDEDKNKDINLSLPGWGSWAGCGIDPNKQVTKRLILKFPKKEERKKQNSENVYINQAVNKKLKEHLVSDLPFPFTSVKDYEASLRQPVGREFIPETAFRMLTRPTVVTRKGKIIEPIDERVLVAKPKRPRTVVDARINEMLEQKKKK